MQQAKIAYTLIALDILLNRCDIYRVAKVIHGSRPDSLSHSLSLGLCLSVCLCVCLSVCRSLSVCLSVSVLFVVFVSNQSNKITTDTSDRLLIFSRYIYWSQPVKYRKLAVNSNLVILLLYNYYINRVTSIDYIDNTTNIELTFVTFSSSFFRSTFVGGGDMCVGEWGPRWEEGGPP